MDSASNVKNPSWFEPEEWRQFEDELLQLAQGELHEIPENQKNFLRQKNLNERQMYELVDFLQAKLQAEESLFPAPKLPKLNSGSQSSLNINAYHKKLEIIALKLKEAEKTYLHQLEQLDEILKPRILKSSPPPDVRKLLDQTAVLLPMTRTLYSDLDKVIDPTLVEFEELARLIIEYSHSFKMYHLYAQAYPNAKKWFQNLKDSKKKKIGMKIKGSTVLEILRAPMKRPTDIISSIFHMYNLSSKIGPESEMTRLLKAAHEELLSADESRKDYIEEVARREVVMDVQKMFSVNVNFIDAHRKLVKEGGLVAIEHSKQLQTTCFLFTDQIVVAMKGPKKRFRRGKQKFTAAKLISFTVRCHCEASKSEPTRFWVRSNLFVIHNQKKVNEYKREDQMSYKFIFEVPSPKLRDEWVYLIKSCLPSVSTLGRKKYELLLQKETLPSLKALMLELGIKDIGLTEKIAIVHYIAESMDMRAESHLQESKLREQFIRDAMARKSSTWVPRRNSLSNSSEYPSARKRSMPMQQEIKRSPNITPMGPGNIKPRRRFYSKQDISEKEYDRVRVFSAPLKPGEAAAFPNGDDRLSMKVNSEEDPKDREMVAMLYGDSLERKKEREGDITTPEIIDPIHQPDSPPPLDISVDVSAQSSAATPNALLQPGSNPVQIGGGEMSPSVNMEPGERSVGRVTTEDIFLRESEVNRMHQNNELVIHEASEGGETKQSEPKVASFKLPEQHEKSESSIELSKENDEIRVGDKIILVNLVAHLDLMHQEAVIIEGANNKGKFAVQLRKTGEKVLVASRNICLLESKGENNMNMRILQDDDVRAMLLG